MANAVSEDYEINLARRNASFGFADINKKCDSTNFNWSDYTLFPNFPDFFVESELDWAAISMLSRLQYSSGLIFMIQHQIDCEKSMETMLKVKLKHCESDDNLLVDLPRFRQLRLLKSGTCRCSTNKRLMMIDSLLELLYYNMVYWLENISPRS